ncbi:hypothetical protein [Rubrivivax rivuli]|uniref:Uncharacterized protein n=1 Tax=Rubrivivax rivuli TaxID=1862385 RepID=A0A437RKA5_9BURK|nr:hypothetical protein [Rubrivivax rivuli]RVU47075.1 hypothetical protein EOE66_04725 [Rubrivivax rivuli]
MRLRTAFVALLLHSHGLIADAAEPAHVAIGPLMVKYPTAGQWSVFRKTESGVIFVRQTSDHAYFPDTAIVNVCPTSVPNDSQAWQMEVEKNIEQHFRGSNAIIVSKSVERLTNLMHACARVRAVIDVSSAAANMAHSGPILRQIVLHLCRLPDQPVGYLVAFSYVAESIRATMESDGASFFAGVLPKIIEDRPSR